jgi:Zn-dependent protease with chaperone function
LGLFVDLAVDYISPDMELTIYDSVGMNRWDKEVDSASASDLEPAAQVLLNGLAQCIDVGYPVTLQSSDSEEINAFAYPGGTIVVLSGTFEKLESLNGLAYVLAHELAHFKHRDHLRAMGRGVVLVALSTFLGGANSNLAGILTPFGSLESAQFSQARERAADATALEVLNCHYGHVGGATELFEAIAGPADNLGFPLTHYFSSHPEALLRIDAINVLIRSQGYRVGQTITLKGY